jgi:hypothetical protein
LGSVGGVGHSIAALNLSNKNKKIVVYGPNAGFTQLAKDPSAQMAQFVTA